MKRLSGLLLAATLAVGSANVFADGSRIGVVDLQP